MAALQTYVEIAVPFYLCYDRAAQRGDRMRLMTFQGLTKGKKKPAVNVY